MTVNLDERAGYLILGCFIGFVLGYITRYLQKIDKSVAQVVRDAKEDGFISRVSMGNIAVFIVVLLTAYAAISSQLAVNQTRSDDKQDDRQDEAIAIVSECNSDILTDTINALNERTTYSADNAKANVALVESQKKFLTEGPLAEPPPTQSQFRGSLLDYVNKVAAFVDVANKAAGKVNTFKYPSKDALRKCINQRMK